MPTSVFLLECRVSKISHVGSNLDFGRILVRDPPTHIELAKPFSPDLAHQWGLDVMCLPYNVLPFDILDKTRTLSYTDAVVSENMRFSPQSVKMNLVRNHSHRLTTFSDFDRPPPIPFSCQCISRNISHESRGHP